jgi:hypothetical protein
MQWASSTANKQIPAACKLLQNLDKNEKEKQVNLVKTACIICFVSFRRTGGEGPTKYIHIAKIYMTNR